MLVGLTALTLGAQPVAFSAETLRIRQSAGGVEAVSSVPLQNPASPHYDVVALRVEFQTDTTRFTTGEGTFAGDLYSGLTPRVDPLPHDAAYFQAHLDFLADYVARVSDGQTTLTTRLAPGVVRVSKPMGDYSPTGPDSQQDDELRKLAALVQEAWTTAEAQGLLDLTGLDPATTAFVLFHAGVGRDIELIGTTLDKTPQDLPSIFFNPQSFQRLLGTEALSVGGFPINHTLVLPRTETRRGFNFITDEPFLAEFSINGLLAASFFNYLGVPDLFNTETGESAIGPFGLMDALGIFAYNGLFPPEPDAWTKLFLGWATVTDVLGTTEQTVTLPYAAHPDSHRVARVRIASAEYFLVENRNRDPEGDGVVLRVWQNGQTIEQRVQNGDATFNNVTVEGFVGGVVVGVDNYDFALPGGVDEDDNPLNGGLLIWHIDERVIQAGLADNRVNVDPQHRGVDLEEADSGQDLGFPSGGLGPQNELGSPFDFWYADNPITVITPSGQEVRLYQNRFGADTQPNSHNNAGGVSLVELDQFSPPGAEMQFRYNRQETAGIVPLFTSFPVIPGAILPDRVVEGSAITTVGEPEDQVALMRVGRGGLAALDLLQGTRFLQANAFILPAAVTPDQRAAVLEDLGDGHGLQLFRENIPSRRFTFSLPEGIRYDGRHSVLFYDAVGDFFYAFFGDGPVKAIGRFEGDGNNDSQVIDYVAFEGVDPEPLSLAYAGNGLLGLAGRTRAGVLGMDLRWTYNLPPDAEAGQVAFGRDASGLVAVLPRRDTGELLFLQADGAVLRIPVAAYLRTAGVADTLSFYPVLVDLDGDARLDVLTSIGATLVAFTQGGSLVDGFPLELAAPLTTQPLVAKLTDSGRWCVVVGAADGFVYAYDTGRGGGQVAGFPLSVGTGINATPLLKRNRLYSLSNEATFEAWQLDPLGEIWWGQLYGNPQNTSYVELVADPDPAPTAAGSLLVEGETYNWPNPIRDAETRLRFRPTQACRVRITIVDAAGSLVHDATVENVPGGVPSEYVWQTTAASGLYFARITATTPDGQSDTALVKMAIIR
jgi:hypothetical protein